MYLVASYYSQNSNLLSNEQRVIDWKAESFLKKKYTATVLFPFWLGLIASRLLSKLVGLSSGYFM